MNQSESIAKLSEALAKAQSEMSHAHKGAANPFFKSKYADLPSVIDAARPHLSANGLSVIQPTDFDGESVWVVTQLNHSSGEWIRGRYKIKPVKEDPQGVGSAITYARRYAYQSMVGIATSLDDDDGNAASGVKVKAESSASQQRRMKVFLAALSASDSPSNYLAANIEAMDEYLDFPEKEMVQANLAENIFNVVAMLIESSDDPQAVWYKEGYAINWCKDYSKKHYNDLIAAAKSRKAELEAKQ